MTEENYEDELVKKPESIEDILIVSEKDLRLFYNCPYSYYLYSNIGVTKIPWNTSFVQKMLFLNERRELFNVNDKDSRRLMKIQRRAGPDLNHVEQMDKDELEEYLKYSSLGNMLSGTWFRILENNEIYDHVIAWNYKSQKGPAGQALKKAGDNYHNFVLENGPPVLGTMDYEAVFFHKGIGLKTRFPEIRKNFFIDDFGLSEFPGNLSNSSLVTLRALGFCTLAYERPLLRLKWGISDQEAEKLGGNEMYISPNLNYRYINLSKNEISITNRSDDDLDELMNYVNMFLEKTNSSNPDYRPNSTRVRCGRCTYNVIGKNKENICRHAHEKSNPAKPIEFFN